MSAVNRLYDRVQESPVGVGSEIDDHLTLGCDSTGHLDIQHDLTVRIRARVIVTTVHGHCPNRRMRDAELVEICFQIASAVASTQFDKGYALPGAIPGRKIVQICNLRRGKRRSGSPRPLSPLGCRLL
jgi:hypothetical protein